MNKIEKNLKADGFEFLEDWLDTGILTVSKGEFKAHFVHETKLGKLPEFSQLANGNLYYRGTLTTHGYDSFLAAVVTCEFDFETFRKEI